MPIDRIALIFAIIEDETAVQIGKDPLSAGLSRQMVRGKIGIRDIQLS